MRLLFTTALAALALSALAQTEAKANAGSIYGSQVQNPYLDRVAREKGDLLMVVIDEQSASTFVANTKTSNTSSNSTTSSMLNAINFLFGPFSNSSDSSKVGQGQTDQLGKMSARMSVMVKDVLPNGYLVIEGTRSLVTNKDTQTFVLSGIVRPADIASDNSVVSSKIGDAHIAMQGKGQIADRQRKGLLTQILDWIF
ncbi:MAG: flagellar basal body L-ring protein FlgH [Fimbriimonadaceae bacterium]|nr:flagellar basal body L-ring protein FlgH [Fimbriimonadaceae bacterium]